MTNAKQPFRKGQLVEHQSRGRCRVTDLVKRVIANREVHLVEIARLEPPFETFQVTIETARTDLRIVTDDMGPAALVERRRRHEDSLRAPPPALDDLVSQRASAEWETERAALETVIADLKSQVFEEVAKLEALTVERDRLEEALARLETLGSERVDEHLKTLRGKEKELDLLRRRLVLAQDQISSLQRTLKDDRAKNQASSEAVAENIRSGFRREITRLGAELAEANRLAANAENDRQQLNAERASARTLANQVSELRNQTNTAEKEKTKLVAELAEANAVSGTLRANFRKSEAELIDLRAQLEAARQELAAKELALAESRRERKPTPPPPASNGKTDGVKAPANATKPGEMVPNGKGGWRWQPQR